jgi:hypothetical protein
MSPVLRQHSLASARRKAVRGFNLSFHMEE